MSAATATSATDLVPSLPNQALVCLEKLLMASRRTWVAGEETEAAGVVLREVAGWDTSQVRADVWQCGGTQEDIMMM